MTENPTPPDESPQPQDTGAAPAAPGLLGPDTADSKTMGMLCHLLVIFTGFIGPLIIWLIKKQESRFVDQQGKEALNWALSLLIVSAGLGILMFIPILGWIVSCLAWPALAVCNIVFGILSTIKVNGGEPYRYPVCIRLIT